MCIHSPCNLQGISPGTRTRNQNVPCVSGDLIHGAPFSIANQEEISGQLSSACCPRVMTSSLPLFSSLPPPPYHYRKSLCSGDKKTWSGSYCAPGSPSVTSHRQLEAQCSQLRMRTIISISYIFFWFLRELDEMMYVKCLIPSRNFANLSSYFSRGQPYPRMSPGEE